MRYPDPTPEEQQDFLVRLYFGGDKDDLERCISRAYLDFNRTLVGIGNLPGAKAKAASHLHDSLLDLSSREAAIASQSDFDNWHKQICKRLKEIFESEGYSSFSVGHAQKLVNMSLKYIFVLGATRIPGFIWLYKYCHVPIDRIILQRVAKSVPSKFGVAWSKLNDYSNYLDFQTRFRIAYSGSSPLAVEFRVWSSPENAA
jgi:hypothetical protein